MDLFTKVYRMTKEQKAECEKILEKYEPYPIDDIEFDGNHDRDRMSATMAKFFLEHCEIIDDDKKEE